jgi:iron-sulfur cluster repair protein YtfE (RIC family)
LFPCARARVRAFTYVCGGFLQMKNVKKKSETTQKKTRKKYEEVTNKKKKKRTWNKQTRKAALVRDDKNEKK